MFKGGLENQTTTNHSNVMMVLRRAGPFSFLKALMKHHNWWFIRSDHRNVSSNVLHHTLCYKCVCLSVRYIVSPSAMSPSIKLGLGRDKIWININLCVKDEEVLQNMSKGLICGQNWPINLVIQNSHVIRAMEGCIKSSSLWSHVVTLMVLFNLVSLHYSI